MVVDRMRAGAGNNGFDAARSVYCDLVEAGIIEPTKVVRMALENAVSVAGVLLLSEATMTEPPEPAKHAHAPMEPVARSLRLASLDVKQRSAQAEAHGLRLLRSGAHELR